MTCVIGLVAAWWKIKVRVSILSNSLWDYAFAIPLYIIELYAMLHVHKYNTTWTSTPILEYPCVFWSVHVNMSMSQTLTRDDRTHALIVSLLSLPPMLLVVRWRTLLVLCQHGRFWHYKDYVQILKMSLFFNYSKKGHFWYSKSHVNVVSKIGRLNLKIEISVIYTKVKFLKNFGFWGLVRSYSLRMLRNGHAC